MTSSARAAGAASWRPRATAAATRAPGPPDRVAVRGGAAHPDGQPQPEQQVEPEDRPPVGDGEHGRTGQRAQHRARLLYRADGPER